MTDTFVFDVLPDLVDIIVIVVDILTSDEQVFIFDNVMEKIISFSTADHPKYLFVVHNFKTLTTKKAVKQYIESDIIKAFNFTERPRKWRRECKGYEGRHVVYYTSKYKGKQITHFVFAAEGTEAGSYYNPIATEWLSRRTNDMQCMTKKVNVLNHFIQKLELSLRDYFYHDAITHATIINNPFNPIVTLRRGVRWVSGGWLYGDTQLPESYRVALDPSSDPFKLKFEALIGDENIDGNIALKDSRDLEYCPTNKISDTPQCKPKIYCNVWRNVFEWGLQCMLADGDFSESIENFNQDIATKLFVLMDANTCELIIYGTILPSWREHVDEENIDSFQLLYTDGTTHGFVERRFVMETVICTRYQNNNDINFKNGVLTVTVKLTDKGEL
eukprot:34039_1